MDWGAVPERKLKVRPDVSLPARSQSAGSYPGGGVPQALLDTNTGSESVAQFLRMNT